ncbi:hypothetical protein [Streptomyces fractus]|uniref:hypothetical protein n=1 Tax=Streptomyces fractus TaxID=641806 RepID=UPI003CE9549A
MPEHEQNETRTGRSAQSPARRKKQVAPLKGAQIKRSSPVQGTRAGLLASAAIQGAEEVVSRSYIGARTEHGVVPAAAPAATTEEPESGTLSERPEAPEKTEATEQPVPPAAEGARDRTEGWAHRAVLASAQEGIIDRKLGSDTWQTHPFRFAPDLFAALGSRVAQDRAASGRQALTTGHYVDAAMRRLPEDVEAQVALARSFLTARSGEVAPARQSGYRVSPEVYRLVSGLPDALRAARHGRIAVHVYSAALDALLRALEEEGPLP